ncbi:MAG: tyrosine protein phosphatase [Acidobacteriia bacterium]|nr:tyrosine protein phosphatase [Terriglobia bacterium]
MKADLFWIPGPWRGRLAIATRPRGGDWLDDEASAWRQADIDVIVSLLENEEADQLDLLDERRVAEDHALCFISFPIPDRSVPASLQEAVLLMGGITAQLEAGKNVAVHCRQGIGRSGLIAAGVLIASGTSPAEAMQIVSSARGIPVPETTEQRRWTERLPSGLALTKS